MMAAVMFINMKTIAIVDADGDGLASDACVEEEKGP